MTRLPPLWSLDVNLDINPEGIEGRSHKVADILEVVLRSTHGQASHGSVDGLVSRSSSSSLVRLLVSSLGRGLGGLVRLLVLGRVLGGRGAAQPALPCPGPALHHRLEGGSCRGEGGASSRPGAAAAHTPGTLELGPGTKQSSTPRTTAAALWGPRSPAPLLLLRLLGLLP